MWLLDKLFQHNNQPVPQFAFQGTVNWMGALSIACDNNDFTLIALNHFYTGIKRKKQNEIQDISSLESLTMALHNASSISCMQSIDSKYNIIRSAIISWYYSVYYCSKAMISAANGSEAETHAKNGKLFQSEIVLRGLAKPPFDFQLQNLTPSNVDQEIKRLRNGNSYDLNIYPENIEMANGALISYLKGTADYERDRLELIVKSTPEFRTLNVENFRTKKAREIRDKKLSEAHVNFLVQSFRYRGKANYRDAIYLSYGFDYTESINRFISDAANVSAAFVKMGTYYISKRIHKETWEHFRDDLVRYAKFELPFEISDI